MYCLIASTKLAGRLRNNRDHGHGPFYPAQKTVLGVAIKWMIIPIIRSNLQKLVRGDDETSQADYLDSVDSGWQSTLYALLFEWVNSCPSQGSVR